MDEFIPILVSLISGVIGAFVGTYYGSYFALKKEEKRKEEVRAIAIKAIDVIKKYAHDGKTYDIVDAEFNNTLSVAEKRIVVVALHKLGIPVIVPSSSKFQIEKVCFAKKVIDKDELNAISNQIHQGHCDHLFFTDPGQYFDDNVRLRTVRALAIRWVREVYMKSIINRETNQVEYPINWFNSYTYGEQLALCVFRARSSTESYFTIKNDADIAKMEGLIRDIELGLWDSCFYWEIENYNNMTANTSINSKMVQFMQNMIGNEQKSV